MFAERHAVGDKLIIRFNASIVNRNFFVMNFRPELDLHERRTKLFSPRSDGPLLAGAYAYVWRYADR